MVKIRDFSGMKPGDEVRVRFFHDTRPTTVCFLGIEAEKTVMILDSYFDRATGRAPIRRYRFAMIQDVELARPADVVIPEQVGESLFGVRHGMRVRFDGEVGKLIAVYGRVAALENAAGKIVSGDSSRFSTDDGPG